MNDATLLCTIYIYGEHKPKNFEHFADGGHDGEEYDGDDGDDDDDYAEDDGDDGDDDDDGDDVEGEGRGSKTNVIKNGSALGYAPNIVLQELFFNSMPDIKYK